MPVIPIRCCCTIAGGQRVAVQPTLPIGFGGADPQVSEVTLEPGDRVLFFTDGITEEHLTGANRSARGA
ncbi:MAG: SpoIIE family protein phosphatase [Acidimicrobiales bacterium]